MDEVFYMVGRTGFEPVTNWLKGTKSNINLFEINHLARPPLLPQPNKMQQCSTHSHKTPTRL